MAYDQAAADWQARAEAAEAELRILREALACSAVPTTPEHEQAHRDMGQRLAEANLGVSMGSTDPTGAPYPQLLAVHRDAEALIAGRHAGQPELIHADLLRMHRELGRAIRTVENMGEEERGA